MHNTGGRDGAGLCVFTSIEMSGRFQNEESLRGFQKYMTTKPGGGYPDKVDKMIAAYAPKVHYIQYAGRDMDLLKLALKTGRMPAVTYGYSPRYRGPIAHMVNLAHLSEHWAAILDNNFPGENSYEWMAPEEFYKRWIAGSPDRTGWLVILLNPPPPPPPHNSTKENLVMYHALLCSLLLAPNGWGAGQPCPVGPEVAPQYYWHWQPSDPQRYYLYKNNLQIGGYDVIDDYYRPFDDAANTWGPKGKPPIDPPAKKPVYIHQTKADPSDDQNDQGLVENHGIDYSKFPHGEECRINGQKVSKSHALRVIEALGDPTLPDDSQKLKLTIFGSKDEQDKVLADLATDNNLTKLRDTFTTQAYPPNHWVITQRGFKIGTTPTIYVERADGMVTHRQEGYAGPGALAQAIKKSDPNYDPAKDPDLSKPPKPEPVPTPAPAPATPPPSPSPLDLGHPVTGGAIGTGLMLLLINIFKKSLPLISALLTTLLKVPSPSPTPPPNAPPSTPDLAAVLAEILAELRKPAIKA
jgi:hypothetical protein